MPVCNVYDVCVCVRVCVRVCARHTHYTVPYTIVYTYMYHAQRMPAFWCDHLTLTSLYIYIYTDMFILYGVLRKETLGFLRCMWYTQYTV